MVKIYRFRFLPALDKLEKRALAPASHTWRDFVPQITLIALGCLSTSEFRMGALATLSTLPIHYALGKGLRIFKCLTCPPKDLSNRRAEYLKTMPPVYPNIIRPILEEFFFRGGIQTLTSYITDSPSLGILISSGVFGSAHYNYNKMAPNYISVIQATMLGVTYALLKNRFGIVTSIAAHITWNTRLSLQKYWKTTT